MTQIPETLAERYDECTAQSLRQQLLKEGYVARYNQWSYLDLLFCTGGPSHVRPSTVRVELLVGTFRSLADAHYSVFVDEAETMITEALEDERASN